MGGHSQRERDAAYNTIQAEALGTNLWHWRLAVSESVPPLCRCFGNAPWPWFRAVAIIGSLSSTCFRLNKLL